MLPLAVLLVSVGLAKLPASMPMLGELLVTLIYIPPAKKIEPPSQPQLRAQQRRNLLNESRLQIISDRNTEKKR